MRLRVGHVNAACMTGVLAEVHLAFSGLERALRPCGIWERLHYDWSDPNRVVLTTTDSNVWGGLSGHTYTFSRQSDGTTIIDLVVVRDGKNLKGRILGLVLGTIGKGVLKAAFSKSVRAIEARNRPAVHLVTSNSGLAA